MTGVATGRHRGWGWRQGALGGGARRGAGAVGAFGRWTGGPVVWRPAVDWWAAMAVLAVAMGAMATGAMTGFATGATSGMA